MILVAPPADSLQAAFFKLKVLASIFCDTKITLQGINWKFWKDDVFEAFGKIIQAEGLSTNRKERKAGGLRIFCLWFLS